MHVTDLFGEAHPVVRVHESGNTVFQGETVQLGDMYLAMHARIHTSQTTQDPVLLMRHADFVLLGDIMATSSSGASFGSGYGSLPVQTGTCLTDAVAVWEIPGELLRMATFHAVALRNVQLSAGTYPLWIDKWSLAYTVPALVDGERVTLPVHFTNGMSKRASWMTKKRVVMACQDLHVLTDGATTLPAITTRHWMRHTHDSSYTDARFLLRDRRSICAAVRALYRRLGVVAYPVRDQHNLLVFVADADGVFTMERFVRLLRARKEAFQSALHSVEFYGEWHGSYCAFQRISFDQGRWHAGESVLSSSTAPALTPRDATDPVWRTQSKL